jgi:hypothetical protein
MAEGQLFLLDEEPVPEPTTAPAPAPVPEVPAAPAGPAAGALPAEDRWYHVLTFRDGSRRWGGGYVRRASAQEAGRMWKSDHRGASLEVVKGDELRERLAKED